MTTPEGKVKAKLRKVLAEFADRVWTFWPVPSGFQAATLDVLGCVKLSETHQNIPMFFAIEMKAPGGHLTARQAALIVDFKQRLNIPVFIIYDDAGIEDLRAWLTAVTI